MTRHIHHCLGLFQHDVANQRFIEAIGWLHFEEKDLRIDRSSEASPQTNEP